MPIKLASFVMALGLWLVAHQLLSDGTAPDDRAEWPAGFAFAQDNVATAEPGTALVQSDFGCSAWRTSTTAPRDKHLVSKQLIALAAEDCAE